MTVLNTLRTPAASPTTPVPNPLATPPGYASARNRGAARRGTAPAVPDWLRAERRGLQEARALAAELAAALHPAPGPHSTPLQPNPIRPEPGQPDPTRPGHPHGERALARLGTDDWVDLLLDQARTALDLMRQADRDDPASPGRRLGELVARAHEQAEALHRLRRQTRTDRLTAASTALAHLHRMPTSADLVERACGELVARCGFGRAVLSRVSGRAWSPWLACFSDAGEHERWFGPWVDRTVVLDGDEPEALVLAERRPALVRDTASTTVCRQIIVDAGRSAAYVAAPVVAGGEVVGILHADHNAAGRLVDDVDGDVLWAFAQGFGLLYERMVLTERAQAQRDQVRTLMAAVALPGPAPSVLAPAAQERGSPPVGAGVAGLTTREAEVLTLIVAGAANRAIADRLVISEDTVKTHVKHILRKIGAANRAQAIAMAAGRFREHTAPVR